MLPLLREIHLQPHYAFRSNQHRHHVGHESARQSAHPSPPQRQEILHRGEDRSGSNGELTDEAAIKILAKLAKQGRDTAALYTEQNRPDLAESELAEVAVIETYLPKALTDEELTAALREIIAEVGATSPKEMGKVMGVASKRLAGRADGRAISEKVKALLA